MLLCRPSWITGSVSETWVQEQTDGVEFLFKEKDNLQTEATLETLTTDMNPVTLGGSGRRRSHLNGPSTYFQC